MSDSAPQDPPPPPDPYAGMTPRERAREERRERNREAWATDPRNKNRIKPKAAIPPEEPIDAGSLKTHADLEIEARRLYQRSLANLETILKDPNATNQDRLQAASHLRLAAGIGQSDPAPTVYILPMSSLLGADAPDQPAPQKEEE